MFFPKSLSQDASEEYTQLNIKICDFSHLGTFGCSLTGVYYIRRDSEFLKNKFDILADYENAKMLEYLFQFTNSLKTIDH